MCIEGDSVNDRMSLLMNYLIVAPQLGYEVSGRVVPGGLLQFGRCVARAMASFKSITRLGIWCQVDPPGVEDMIFRMVQPYAHPALQLDIRAFGGQRLSMASAICWANLSRFYDRIMYLLVNQSVLNLLPFHRPCDVWEIGEELFEPISIAKYRALSHADRLLSISYNTTKLASHFNPGLPRAQVVHLCLEPLLFSAESNPSTETSSTYEPARRDRAVLIVANMHSDMPYKGHKELIAAWPEVIRACPDAQLWLVGDGDGRPRLQQQAQALPREVAKNIIFLGRIANDALEQVYKRCRVFAMPSTGEGFGLVYVEAARFGLPSIAGKYDSAKEIVLDQQTGLLVEQESHAVAQACLQLLLDDNLARRLGEAARQRFLQYFQFRHFCERLEHTLELEQ
jgi:phosphatidyl-myo-inositol dimannoside synthase